MNYRVRNIYGYFDRRGRARYYTKGDSMVERQSPPTVLVVEDEPDLLDLYATWLRSAYSVKTASSGEDALQVLDNRTDIVLLDRRMPDMTGDQTLQAIRERGYTCPVAMVTAVDPDFDIIELGCDEYLTKPVSKGEMRETVDRLRKWTTYNDQLREYYSLVSQKALLGTEKSPSSLDASEEYAVLLEHIEDVEN